MQIELRQKHRGLAMGPPSQPRARAAYFLPTLLTAGNIYLGFISVLESILGMLAAHNGATGAEHFNLAAKSIGLAVLLDGLDGRIARMTNTCSDFGREMDSLADVISFGFAPAVLAFAWGVHSLDPTTAVTAQILRAGLGVAFLFLLSGAVRLARFNVQKNPVPKNPGRPGRRYFVGLPIPAAAATVAAVVYAGGGIPVASWPLSVGWLGVLALLSFLMVSTWRYNSFKEINSVRLRSPLTVLFVTASIYLTYRYPQPIFLICAACYAASGIVARAGGMVKRYLQSDLPQEPEHQVG
jgi:CDP-diacylglycerol--serine O-phosphatidyltransferase